MWVSNLPEGAISVCTHYTQTDILFTERFSSDPTSPNLPLMILLEKYWCYIRTSLTSSWLHLHLNDYLNNNVISLFIFALNAALVWVLVRSCGATTMPSMNSRYKLHALLISAEVSEYCFLDRIRAFWYYDSWWDIGGMRSKTGGIHPTSCRPKPRPTTPRNFFDTVIIQYQNEKCQTK